MAIWEHQEFFIAHGPNRDRKPIIDGLNKLGLEGWQAINSKDIIAPQVIDGKSLMTDGVRFLMKREAIQKMAAEVNPTPDAIKRMRDKPA